jgi:hypothetical protein
MKNKKSLKNLKQFRNRVRFTFYVLFRPLAQKVFFVPLLMWIAWLAVTDWYNSRGVWDFQNETQAGAAAQSVAVSLPMGDTTANTENPVPVKAISPGEAKGEASPDASRTLIQKVAAREGIDWKILYAICKKESNCEDRIGDGGKSIGPFQIHTGYHPTISPEKAKDLEWSAEWTAKRLKRFAHLGEKEMVRSHNGLVPNNANAYYVEDVYQIISNL